MLNVVDTIRCTNKDIAKMIFTYFCNSVVDNNVRIKEEESNGVIYITIYKD
jgi:hypothetical protein